MANTNITIRIDEELKGKLQKLMSDLGMDLTVVLQIIYGFMLHFIYNYFQDYLECNITLFKPDYVH